MAIKATTKDAYKLIHDGVLAFSRAERQGIRLDTEYCERKRKHLSRKIKYYEEKLMDTNFYKRWQHIYGTRTNIHSNQQLANFLYNKMKITPPKMTEKAVVGSTDEQTLQRLNIPELDILLKIRKLEKIKETYLGGFIRENNNGYLHPTFLLHTVRTYRSSSADPNFQNIPKRDKEAMQICRKALLPRENHQLIEADFSALEVMISACYHKDPKMLQYLNDKKSDMHLDMAKQIFLFDEMDKSNSIHAKIRQGAKNGFVFPQFYGDYYANNAKALAEWVELPMGIWKDNSGIQLPENICIGEHLRKKGIKSFKQFTDYMQRVENDFWNNRFRVYNEWRKERIKQYRKNGYLDMYTGFRCSGIMRQNEIVNYPIQGTAFHCLLFTFIEMDRKIQKEKWDSKLIGQIHDSIIMDVHPDELLQVKKALQHIVKEVLPNTWKWINVPLEIDIDVYGVNKSWASSPI